MIFRGKNINRYNNSIKRNNFYLSYRYRAEKKKMDTNKNAMMLSIIDIIMGDSQGNINNPIISEDDIRVISRQISNENWRDMPLRKIVEETIDSLPDVFYKDYTIEEIIIMETDLKNRLYKRFKRYLPYSSLIIKDSKNGIYGFQIG